MEGTEALDGAKPAAAAPSTDASTAQAMLQASNQDAGPAPAPADVSGMTAGQQPPDMGAPAQPNIAPPSPLAKIFASVLDFLQPPQQTTVSRDANGNRVVTPTASLTHGQQLARLGLTMAQGATTAMAAPPGPGHVGAGASAAFQQGMKQTVDAAQQKEDNADKDFAIQQKAKMDNANYQLLTREVTRAGLMNTEMQAKNTKDGIDFSNSLVDREKALYSYDLGTVKNAGEIADTISKLPDWEQSLYKHNALMPITEHAPDGTVTGIHLYLRKPDVGSAPAAEGAVAHKFVPPMKPGDKPQLVAFTPTDHPTNAQIANYDLKAQQDQQQYLENQHKDDHLVAQTKELRANTAKAYAEADKARADAADTRQKAMDGNGLNDNQLVQGMLNKTVDIRTISSLRNDHRQRLVQEAMAANPNWKEKDYEAAMDLQKDANEGPLSKSIASFNRFAGHAAGLNNAFAGLRNGNSPLINKPLNKIKADVLGQVPLTDVRQFMDAAANEHMSFLMNGRAPYESDKQARDKSMNENMTPAQLNDAIKSDLRIQLTQLGAMNQRYTRMVERPLDSNQISPETREIINNFGLGDYAAKVLGSTWTGQQPQGNQQQQQQPQQQQQQQPGAFDWNAHPKAN